MGEEAAQKGLLNRYRKKPVVIQAWRWNPDDMKSAGTIIGLMMAGGLDARVGADGSDASDKRLLISTLEGVMAADPGDWIIRGVKGELLDADRAGS